MWTIIKFEKKKINLLKEDLKKKVGCNYKIYIPKLLVEKLSKNKLIKKEINLLGDYLFCFNKKFKNKNSLSQLNNLRGVKFYLSGFVESQKEISSFINKCKNSENDRGYLSFDFFDIKQKLSYKLCTGPFSDQIFKFINLEKNKIKILMGNFKTTIDKKNLLFKPC